MTPDMPARDLVQDYRLVPQMPWLDAARAGIVRMLRGERLAHGLLLQGRPGLGKAALADWIARLVLCDARGDEPCGRCPSCIQHAAGTHPDLVRIGVAADKKQIAVDDVRDLLGHLALKSLRGGWKVALLAPADALNAHGANALLKTLEEPSPGTLLMLVAARPERLPRTIVSRCQRLAVAAPERTTALAWLAARAPGDWSSLLELAGGGPLAALQLAQDGGRELIADLTGLVEALSCPGGADVVAAAERFARDHPAERLRYLEHWTSEAIRAAVAGAPSPVTRPKPLPAGRPARHIDALYALLDDTRRAQALLVRGAANVQLLFEGVLLQLAGLVAPGSRGVVERKS
jgi:DNA polymerase-3 subunit delta'